MSFCKTLYIVSKKPRYVTLLSKTRGGKVIQACNTLFAVDIELPPNMNLFICLKMLNKFNAKVVRMTSAEEYIKQIEL